MAAAPKSKEIQVQKPAQSLQAFQQSLAAGEAAEVGLLKPVLAVAGVIVLGVLGFFGISTWRAASLDKHETALAELQQEVFGDGLTPVAPAELEKRMREKLPRLELLAAKAPGRARPVTEATLAAWKLQLEGRGGVTPKDLDPWGRLRLAQRQIALGQGAEAAASLAPLHKEAGPDAPWSALYWTSLMDLHRLKGDRDQALKDFADYKNRYKERADPTLERTLAGI